MLPMYASKNQSTEDIPKESPYGCSTEGLLPVCPMEGNGYFSEVMMTSLVPFFCNINQIVRYPRCKAYEKKKTCIIYNKTSDLIKVIRPIPYMKQSAQGKNKLKKK